MPITAGMALTAVAGAGKTIGGLIGAHDKQQQLDALKRPVKTIEDEWLANQSLAEARANSGMSDATKDYYTTEAQRGLAAGISATLQGGGSVNTIQDQYGSYDRSLKENEMRDAELQNRNTLHYMDINKGVAGQKAMNWVTNVLDPYKDKVQSLTSQIAADKQNAMSGVSDVAGSLTAFGVSQQNKDLISLLGKKDGTTGVTKSSIISSLNTGDPYPVNSRPAGTAAEASKNLSDNLTVNDMLNVLSDEDKTALQGVLSKALSRPQ